MECRRAAVGGNAAARSDLHQKALGEFFLELLDLGGVDGGKLGKRKSGGRLAIPSVLTPSRMEPEPDELASFSEDVDGADVACRNSVVKSAVAKQEFRRVPDAAQRSRPK
jgi:hypothetical protein